MVAPMLLRRLVLAVPLLLAGCAVPSADIAPAPFRQVVDLGSSPSRGPADAPVTLVEFADYACPHCHGEEAVVAQLLSRYATSLRFVYKQLPVHSDSALASEASLAANAQGKFWPYHDALFADQAALARPDLELRAESLELDMTAFRAALDQQTYAPDVAADVAEGDALGVPGTPTFFVNGRVGVGALPYDVLAQAIDEELSHE